jgi:sec-independent protein translocase protein TatC
LTNKYAALLRQKQVPAHKIMIIFQCITGIIKQIRFMNQQKSVANCAGFTYTAFINLLKSCSEIGVMAENKRNSEDDLKKMSLGDHLEELRIRMILALAGLLIGLVVCLFFGKYLISVLETPYHRAIGSHHSNAVHDPNSISSAGNETSADYPQRTGLQTRKPAEGFITYIKICLVFGLLLSSPWVFWQAWAFVSAGLYKHERKFVHVVSPVSAVLFISGALFFLFMVAPLAMTFFIKFNERLNLSSFWMFEDYINMILLLTLVFGLAFQMPIAIVFAERMGLVSIEMLIKSRKYVIVALTVIAAIATPPDVISQISLFVPMYILFEGSVVTCRFLDRKKQRT